MMSAEVISAAIGASATVCVSCVPIILRLRHMYHRKSTPDRGAVCDELARVNMKLLDELKSKAGCLRVLLGDVLDTYTKIIVALLYDEKAATTETTRSTSTSEETTLFQSLLVHAGTETTESLLREIGSRYAEYYQKIRQYNRMDRRVQFLLDTYEYFAHSVSRRIRVRPTDLIVFNNITNEFTYNLNVKRALNEKLGYNVHYVVVEKPKLRTMQLGKHMATSERIPPISHPLTISPVYLQAFHTMEELLDSPMASDAACARRVWGEWLHENFAHPITVVTFAETYSLYALESTREAISIVSISEKYHPSTFKIIHAIHTGMYSFIACMQQKDETTMVADVVITHAPTPFLQAQMKNIGRRLEHCVDSDTIARMHSREDIRDTMGTWNGYQCMFSVIYTETRSMLFSQLLSDDPAFPFDETVVAMSSSSGSFTMDV